MSKIVKIIISLLIIFIVIAIPVYIYLYTDIGMGKDLISDSDINILKEELSSKYYNYNSSKYEEMNKFPYEIYNEYHIYNIIQRGNAYYIYGYADTGIVVNFNGKLYTTENKKGNFFAKGTIADNNKLMVIDFSNEKEVYYMMSSRAKRQSKIFNKKKFKDDINSDIEKRLGASFDKGYNLKIENGKYEIYSIDNKGNVVYKDQGDLN